jgi:membrane dipeptidase
MRLRSASAVWVLTALSACAASPPLTASSDAAAWPTIIDGHADFAIHYLRWGWSAEAYDIDGDFPGQAGVVRWKAGGVDGVLTTVGSDQEPGSTSHFPRVLASLDWFDTLVARHPQTLVAARTPADFEAAHHSGKIALMAAIEGGDQLDGSLTNLSTAYQRGVRSILIVYDHNNDIGDGAMVMEQSIPVATKPHGGLSVFGRELIGEMNRLGIAVDLSHAAESTALQAIEVSKAPVIFTHSGARALADTPRNLSDRVLRKVAAKRGLVMISLVPYLTTTEHWRWWSAGEARYAGLMRIHPADKDAVSRGMSEWDVSNPQPKVGIADVANMIEYVAKAVGREHVGIGTDFDGMDDFAITGLKDASELSALLRALSDRGWTRSELTGLTRGNFLRVMTEIQHRARP